MKTGIFLSYKGLGANLLHLSYCHQIAKKFGPVSLITLNPKLNEVLIDDSNFQEIVLDSDKPVMVDFWAEWCGPCRMVGPIIDEISNDYSGKAIVGKLDVDNNQEFAAKYGVRNIPTVLIFNKGELVDRKVGVSSKQTYAEALDALI